MIEDEFRKSKLITELILKDFKRTKNSLKVIHPDIKNKECGIVLFYHHWCPHCQRIVPEWESLSQKVHKKVFVCSVHGSNEADGNHLIFNHLGIHGVPEIKERKPSGRIDNTTM